MPAPLPAVSQAKIPQAAKLFLDNRITESNSVIDELCAAHPDHILVWRILNNLYLAQGRAVDAVSYFRRHLPSAPTYETMEHFCLLARAERYAGNPARAAEITDQVLAIEPTFLEARFEYGLAYYHLLPVRQDCNWKTISVCLPSRFTQHAQGWYWLERAVNSIRAQTIAGKFPIQICVGIDHGADIPVVFQNQPDVVFAPAAADAPRCQAAAVNAAAAVATGDIIAFLEDDDAYYPQRLEHALGLLERYDFVGGTQQAVGPTLVPFEKIQDYANPTTWVMRHDFWRRVGPMDTNFRIHLDAEWLGRLNASGGLRVHEVDAPAPREWHALATQRQFFMYFYSVIKPGSGAYFTPYAHPLAAKTIHDNSLSDITRANPVMQARSDEEHARMEAMYNGRPF